jgi:hypothetical protein
MCILIIIIVPEPKFFSCSWAVRYYNWTISSVSNRTLKLLCRTHKNFGFEVASIEDCDVNSKKTEWNKGRNAKGRLMFLQRQVRKLSLKEGEMSRFLYKIQTNGSLL